MVFPTYDDDKTGIFFRHSSDKKAESEIPSNSICNSEKVTVKKTNRNAKSQSFLQVCTGPKWPPTKKPCHPYTNTCSCYTRKCVANQQAHSPKGYINKQRKIP